MYHCPVTIYLVGLPDEIARIIEDAQPQPSFTHHFTRSDEPEEALTAQASAIFADATGHRRLGPRLRRSPAGHHNGHPHRHPRPSARRRALLQRHRRPVDRALERRRGILALQPLAARLQALRRLLGDEPVFGSHHQLYSVACMVQVQGRHPPQGQRRLLRHGEQDQRAGAGPRARLHLGRGSRRSRLH